MIKKALLASVVSSLLTALVITIGCGGTQADVSGMYVLEANPELYIELRSDGTFDA